MRIGFDAKRAFLNSSGLGNYARTLVSSLHSYFPDNQYTLFTTRRSDNEFDRFTRMTTGITVKEPISFIDKKLRSRWRSYGITHQLKNIDVYHGLSNELPFNISEFKGKKVVTIHDLIFLRYPKLYPYLDRKIYNKKFRHACDAADQIIAISEETKRDISEHYFIPESKISVIYQSCDPSFFSAPDDDQLAVVREKYQLPSEFLLYVGTIEERKNLLLIVKALEEVKDIPLVIIGKKKSYLRKVMEYAAAKNLTHRLIFPEHVSNADLPAVYRLSTIFIFPSFFEGFGIPIIEALVSHVPVITTKGGVFPEAGGPDTIYIDPENPAELAATINALLLSESQRLEIAAKGAVYAEKFHPERVASELIQLYQS